MYLRAESSTDRRLTDARAQATIAHLLVTFVAGPEDTGASFSDSVTTSSPLYSNRASLAGKDFAEVIMRRRNVLLAATVLSALVWANCGGGSPPPPPVAVTVTPASQRVRVGGAFAFLATVTNTNNLMVTWKVNGVTGGNLATTGSISTAGLYTAPANIPTPAMVTVTAVSQADPTRSGSASVTVTVAVSVTPSQAVVNLSTSTQPVTQQFMATVSGQSNNSVTWEVNGTAGGDATVGTITNTGLYTAPNAIPNPSRVAVTAVSQADPTQSGNALVTIGDVTINQGAQAVPIKLGTSGGNEKDSSAKFCCSGTLGSLVARGSPPTYYILSNSHVLARSGLAAAAEPVDQPGLADTNCSPATLVAKFTQAAPLQDGGVDAAIAEIVPGQVDLTGQILQLGAVGGAGVPQPEAPANTVAAATVSQAIAKSGRTTGLSCGTVQVTNALVQVDYQTSCGGTTLLKTVHFTNQIMTSANFADAGDSGSLIVDSTTAQPVALLYAGDSTGAAVGNPMQQVLDAFKSGTNAATIVGGPQHQVSACTGMAAQPAPLAATAERQVFQAAVPAALRVKERHETELMSDPAVLAVGIGTSSTPGQPGIVIYVERGKPHRDIPSALEGIPTRILSSARFKAFDSNSDAVKRCSGKKPQSAILAIP
jgi:hypothetical protein